MDHARSLSAEISCVQATGYIFLVISFKPGKWLNDLDGQKCKKILTHAFVQATGYSSIMISFIVGMCINMLEISPSLW